MTHFTEEDLEEQFETRVGQLIFEAGFTEYLAKQWAMREIKADHGSEGWNKLIRYKRKLKKD